MFQSQYIEKLLNVFNVSMFLNISQFFSIFSKKFYFFYIFGQKGWLNFNFRTNFTLLIKNKKPNKGFNICFLWTLKKCNIETLKFWKTLTSHWIQCSFDIKNIESKSIAMSVQTLTTNIYNDSSNSIYFCLPHNWVKLLSPVKKIGDFFLVSISLRSTKTWRRSYKNFSFANKEFFHVLLVNLRVCYM